MLLESNFLSAFGDCNLSKTTLWKFRVSIFDPQSIRSSHISYVYRRVIRKKKKEYCPVLNSEGVLGEGHSPP